MCFSPIEKIAQYFKQGRNQNTMSGSSTSAIKQTKKKSLKELLEDNIEEEPNPNTGTTKSFWRFRRSNS